MLNEPEKRIKGTGKLYLTIMITQNNHVKRTGKMLAKKGGNCAKDITTDHC
jgi:hypothetical protein